MAFKLAELFVSIAAQDSPLQASIAGLKAKAGAVAGSIGSLFAGAFTGAIDPVQKLQAAGVTAGSKIGTAFAGALGPIGLAFKAIEGLFGQLDEGNEDVAALGEYWDAALKPVVEVFEDVLHSITEWITSMKKAATESETFQAILTTFTDYAAAGFDNLKTAVDQGVAVFTMLKTGIEDAFETAQIYIEGFQSDIQDAFAGSGLAPIMAWGELVQTWVIDKIELVGIFVRNWPDFFQIAWIKISEITANIVATLMTIPDNAKVIGEYIANNWVKLFIDAGNAISSLFFNVGTNLKNTWQAFMDYLKTGKFEVHFEDLLKDFKATADKLPALIQPALVSYEDRIKEVTDRIGQRVFEKHAAKEKVGAGAAVTGGAQTDFKSRSFGAADFAAKIRADIFSPKDDKDEKKIKAAERTAKATEEIATEIKRPKPAKAG